MKIETVITKQVVVSFRVDEEPDFPGVFVLPEEQYALLSPEALEKLQFAKLEEWRAARSPLTQEQVDAAQKAKDDVERASITTLRAVLDAREAELAAKPE